MINAWGSCCLTRQADSWHKRNNTFLCLCNLGHLDMRHKDINPRKKPQYQVYSQSVILRVTAKLCSSWVWRNDERKIWSIYTLSTPWTIKGTLVYKATLTIKLTYLCMIWCLSCGSSSMLTDRSEMETAAEAVSVTSSTSTPSPSSSGRSSLCVCSLLRSDRSMVHLKCTHTHKQIKTELQSIVHFVGKLTMLKQADSERGS